MKTFKYIILLTLFYSLLSCSGKTQIVSQNNIEQAPDLAMEYYKKGRKFFLRFTRENSKKAISLFKKALKIKPKFPLALGALSEALSYYSLQIERNGYNANSTFRLALDMARKAIKLNRNLAEAHRSFAWYYLVSGLHAFCAKHAKKALALKPNCPESSFLLWAATDNKNLDSSNLHKALKANFIIALINAGSLARRKKQFNTALSYFNNVIKIIPKHTHAWVNIGNVYLRLNEPRTSIKYYKKALKLCNNDSYVYFNFAAAYVNMRRYDDALEYYKKAILINPNLINAHLMLARLYQKVFRNKKLYKKHKIKARNLKRKRFQLQLARIRQARREDI